MNDIVFMNDEYAIMRFDKPFGTGFNVYQLDTEEPEAATVKGTKINTPWGWFKTFDAAYDWLQKFKPPDPHTYREAPAG